MKQIHKNGGTSLFFYIAIFCFLNFIPHIVLADKLVLSAGAQSPVNPVAGGNSISFTINMQNIGPSTIAPYLRVFVDGVFQPAINLKFSTSTNCGVFSINNDWFYCSTMGEDSSDSATLTWGSAYISPGTHTIRFEGSCFLYNVDNDGDGFWDGCPTLYSNTIEYTVQVGTTVQFSQTSVTVSENGINAGVYLERAGDLSGASSVQYSMIDGSAKQGDDYVSASKTATWAAGETSVFVPIDIVDDVLVEDTESFTISLSDAAGADIGANSVTTITLTDNDLPIINLSTKLGVAREQGEVAGSCSLFSDNDPNRSSDIAVEFSVSGSAASGADYQPLMTNVQLLANNTTTDITIIPIDDNDIEQQENILLRLVPSINYVIGQNQCEVLIESNDQPRQSGNLPDVSLKIVNAIATETDRNAASVLVSLNSPAAENGLEIRLAFAGSATASDDYLALSETIMIAAGSSSASIEITPVDDDVKEAEETVIVSLVARNTYTVGEQNSVQVSIVDNEPDTTEGSEITISTIGSSVLQQAGLDEDITMTISVSDDLGNLLQGAQVIWTLESSVAGELSLDSTDNITDAKGQASAKFRSAVKPQIYNLKAQVNIENNQGILLEVTQLFAIEAGIASILTPDSPERAVAKSMDNVCRDLDASIAFLSGEQQALLDQCNNLASAAVAGNNAEVQQALKAIAPEEAVSQGVISQDIALQQLSNIGQRLTALRRGIKGVSLSGLSFGINNQSLPGSVLEYALFENAEKNDTSRLPGGLLSDRLGVFVSGGLSIGEKDPTLNESGYEFKTNGITIGADYRYTNELVVGTALGIASTDLNIDAQGGGLNSKGDSLSIFAMLYTNDVSYLSVIASFGSNKLDMNRGINFSLGSTVKDVFAKATTNSASKSISLGGGYQFVHKNTGLTAELMARTDYLATYIEAYKETNAQELNLSIDGQNVESLFVVTGVQTFMALSQKWGVLLPTFSFTWEHEEQTASNITGSFINDPSVNKFSFSSDKEDDNYFRVSGGVSAILPGGISLFFQYDTILDKDYYSEENYSFGGRFERIF